MEKFAIGCDHAGFELKQEIFNYIESRGIAVKDYGTYSNERADYPDFAHGVASAIEEGKHELGVLICGSANGIAMTANKHQGIRCAICWIPEIAALAREHNDANIIALPARFISIKTAIKCLDSFLNSSFQGGRHSSRVDKIRC